MIDRITAIAAAVASIPSPTLATIAIVATALLLAAAKTAATVAGWLRDLPAERRADLAENALVGFFVLVVAGLIMQGLTDFARHDMGLTGVWPYLFFFALDGMAALFAVASYRWAKAGASPAFPRVMVAAIMTSSAWFQWSHATGLDIAGRAAWTALPLIGGVLWEFVLVQRRRAWKQRQAPATEAIPRARWLFAPVQSALMKRRMILWGTTSYEDAVELHITRTESIRRLRRRHGLLWAWRVPADVAYRLRAGVRIAEAASRVDALLDDDEASPVPQARPQATVCGGFVPLVSLTVPNGPDVETAPVPPETSTTPSGRSVPEPGDVSPAVLKDLPEGLNEDVIRLWVTSQQTGTPLSYSEIAERTGVPRSTVGRHIKTYKDRAAVYR